MGLIEACVVWCVFQFIFVRPSLSLTLVRVRLAQSKHDCRTLLLLSLICESEQLGKYLFYEVHSHTCIGYIAGVITHRVRTY